MLKYRCNISLHTSLHKWLVILSLSSFFALNFSHWTWINGMKIIYSFLFLVLQLCELPNWRRSFHITRHWKRCPQGKQKGYRTAAEAVLQNRPTTSGAQKHSSVAAEYLFHLLKICFKVFKLTSFAIHKVALPDAEPLIHFALNCGAKGCPPIKTYTPEVGAVNCKN